MLLRVGRLLKPHGLKGGVFLHLLTDEPKARFAPESVLSCEAGEFTVKNLGTSGGRPVLYLHEVDNRNQAEELTGLILWADVPEDQAQEDAWHDFQLVGLSAFDLTGQPLGKVVRVEHFPAQDILVVAAEASPCLSDEETSADPVTKTAAKEVLVPLVKALVPRVDLGNQQVIIDPPAGMF